MKELKAVEAQLKQRQRDLRSLKKPKTRSGSAAKSDYVQRVNFMGFLINETGHRVELLKEMRDTSYELLTSFAKKLDLPRIPAKKDGLARLERWLKKAQARLDEQAAEALEQKR